ncbi:uncharacterized protein (DUF433 family) [Aureimonas pseudogalii]|uniref:Uncharacterized protein (DUF433 family) n=2 Tax=Aureimonas pseudogalii TaxID=1744844 RepID=A0A7W6H8Q2_9HYPH|nr:uncharacterized protein (DUF433 family) [Aureimonas pseudogalii]
MSMFELRVRCVSMNQAAATHSAIPLDVGSYTAVEAARLLRTPALNIRRWMQGYDHGPKEKRRHSPPLWTPQLAMINDHLEIGFRDLVELRFVKAFLAAGVGLVAVRNCLERARECVEDDHPLSTQRFRTDGRSIFLQTFEGSDEPKLIDLRSRQYVFNQVFERSFKDLDIEDDAVVRWRPYKGKASIVIDPTRSFGQPIAASFGIPTTVLSDAAKAEGSIARAARLYDVPVAVVRDAVHFEEDLLAA